jgi:hypothetical protein
MFTTDKHTLDGLVERANELSRKSDYTALREFLQELVAGVLVDREYADNLLNS